jgi:hypothetical protein
MQAPGGESREELYTNWVAWATTNLGGNATLVEAAANAAADTAFRGEGLEAATNAARKAWFENAQANQSSWRPSFWKLLLSNPFVWALPVLLLVIIASAFQQPVPRAGLVALMLLPIALIFVIWQVGSDALLSLGGTVAPGTLVNVIKGGPSGPREGASGYSAIYEFAFQGQKWTASHGYYMQDSIRQDVMVLFYPRFPGFAKVLPELLNPEST